MVALATGRYEVKIAIVGTGAMGSVYAALLCRAGHEVWAIDIWPEHMDAIATSGLHVSGASGSYIGCRSPKRPIRPLGEASAPASSRQVRRRTPDDRRRKQAANRSAL